MHDVALDAADHPVIVYAVFPTDTDHRYRYARWDGTRWVDRELVRAGRSMSVDPAEPNYSGGISLDHDDPSIVYLSRQVNGVFEVEAWTTPDGGATWSSRPLTAPSTRGNYRPVSPWGQLSDDMDIVWMHGELPQLPELRHRAADADPHPGHRRPGRVGPGAEEAGRVRPGRADRGAAAEVLRGRLERLGQLRRRPGRPPVGPPAVASPGPGRLDVFAVDQVTGQLLQRTYGSGWHSWVNRGYGPAGHRWPRRRPSSWGSGRIDVLASDEVTDDLIHFWQSGTTWYGPERLAAGPGGDYSPSVASRGPRRLDIFAVNSAGSLAQFWFDGTRWHGWAGKGRGPGRSGVDRSGRGHRLGGPGRLDVFALVRGGRPVAHWWYDTGAWRGLQGLGTGPDGIRLAGLSAASWGTGRLDVFATDQERHDLVQLYFDGGWHGPIPQDFNSTTRRAPRITVDPNPRSTPIPVSEQAAGPTDAQNRRSLARARTLPRGTSAAASSNRSPSTRTRGRRRRCGPRRGPGGSGSPSGGWRCRRGRSWRSPSG